MRAETEMNVTPLHVIHVFILLLQKQQSRHSYEPTRVHVCMYIRTWDITHGREIGKTRGAANQITSARGGGGSLAKQKDSPSPPEQSPGVRFPPEQDGGKEDKMQRKTKVRTKCKGKKKKIE